MDTEYGVVDYDGKGEEIEHVGEMVPDVGIPVFPGALGVEAVGLRDAARFVVAADEVDSVRIAQLEADEERYCFDGEQTAVNVVAWEKSAEWRAGGGDQHTQEKIIGVGTGPSNLEYLNHVEELAVDIAHDGNRCPDVHDIALLHEQLLGFGAYCFDDRLG